MPEQTKPHTELRIVRDYAEKDTPGILVWRDPKKGWTPVCQTLELLYHDNRPQVSCIPEGQYNGAVQFSPHFQRDLPELLDVPGRSQILFHFGTWAGDAAKGEKCNTKGCILVGTTINVNTKGLRYLGDPSLRKAESELLRILRGGTFSLIVEGS